MDDKRVFYENVSFRIIVVVVVVVVVVVAATAAAAIAFAFFWSNFELSSHYVMRFFIIIILLSFVISCIFLVLIDNVQFSPILVVNIRDLTEKICLRDHSHQTAISCLLLIIIDGAPMANGEM